MKNLLKILVIFIILVVICLVGLFVWYTNSIKPVDKNATDIISVEVLSGMGSSKIAQLLEEKGVIKSATAFKLYTRLNSIHNLQAGNYELSKSSDLPTIVEKISMGEVTRSGVRITFIEGKNMRWIAQAIANNTKNTEEDVFELLEDEDYIQELIDDYWFITDEIADKRIYYPLEGYLLPDTYEFKNENVSVKEIFSTILDYTDQYLSQFKNEIKNNSMTLHQILTVASIAELEGKTTEDRAEIVGVFANRLNLGMNLGSDVTTYYAFKVDMGERNLTKKEIATENPYNTRTKNMYGKIPVGPICNPSKSAIDATLHFKETDAYYFVADKNGKVYFTKNNDEHLKKVAELKKAGLWFVYE